MREDHSELQASPADEVSWFFDRLFAGIALDETIRLRAHDVISRCVDEMRISRPARPGKWDRWHEAMAMYEARDRQLESLLRPQQRDTFLRNSAELRAEWDAVRANASDPEPS